LDLKSRTVKKNTRQHGSIRTKEKRDCPHGKRQHAEENRWSGKRKRFGKSQHGRKNEPRANKGEGKKGWVVGRGPLGTGRKMRRKKRANGKGKPLSEDMGN